MLFAIITLATIGVVASIGMILTEKNRIYSSKRLQDYIDNERRVR